MHSSLLAANGVWMFPLTCKLFLQKLSFWVDRYVHVVHNIVLPFVSSVCVILVCILRLTYACLCRHSRKLWSWWRRSPKKPITSSVWVWSRESLEQVSSLTERCGYRYAILTASSSSLSLSPPSSLFSIRPLNDDASSPLSSRWVRPCQSVGVKWSCLLLVFPAYI